LILETVTQSPFWASFNTMTWLSPPETPSKLPT
jgi:hypothetical protein